MKKIKNTKGFTLMEMLIVVAIIAILIAIAIPTFNSSLNKAKVATDEANIRSGYAAVMTQLLTSDTAVTDGTTYTLRVDGGVTDPAANYETKGEPSADVDIAGHPVKAWKSGKTVTYTVTTSNDGYDVAIAVAE